ncbi:MAG: hypothetical protein KBD47_00380 [Candidatus Pacebacteria bacterium]|nr:hypothetical protein [Candidatus Paceibacterota bacterium]
MQKKIAADIPQVALTNGSVVESVDTFVDYWVKFFSLAFLWFAVDPMKEEIDRQIKASWTASESELTNFLDSVYRTMQLPLSSKEQRDILKLVNLQGEEFNTALQAHVKTYRHLSVHDIDDQFFDEEYYRGRIKPLNDPNEFKKQKDLLEQADKEITDANSLLESVNLSDTLKNKINFVRWFMYLRTESVDHFMLVNGVYKPLFEFIGNNFGLTVVEVLNMTYKEMIDSLKAGKLALEQSVIKNRTEKGYGYFIGPFTSVLVTGNDIDALEKLVLPQNNNKEIRELKGQVAYPGKVTARARVILDRKHAAELQEGEILVTTMTAPDLVPAMKISAAIITNEGGVLCHAAIMSRELRRPCVIGTKIATDVIKTGDLVEVDAEKGIVRILK